METRFEAAFLKAVKKHPSIRKMVKKKASWCHSSGCFFLKPPFWASKTSLLVQITELFLVFILNYQAFTVARPHFSTEKWPSDVPDLT
jgi:hypothetical protein